MARLRVLDLSHVIAGPYCGWMLGVLGADVVKVERLGGDAMRRLATDDSGLPAGMGIGYLSVNAGKRSIALDFKSAAGREIVLSLAERADVVLESFRAGALDEAGLGHETLMAHNPRLVYCAISGFGQGGPKRGVRAYDHVIQANSGLMAATGEPGGRPTKVGFPVSDSGAGMAAALAILSALFEREETGRGRFIDVSMLDAVWSLMSTQVVHSLVTGAPPPRLGNAAFTRSPTADSFATGDGDILIGANTEEQFRALMAAIGRPDLCADERFADRASREDDRDALRSAVEDALATRSAADWEQVLQSAGVPASAVRQLPDCLHELGGEENSRTRAYAVEGREGSVSLPGAPFLFDGRRPFADLPPPALGADTRAILKELGYSANQISALVDEGVVAGPDRTKRAE